jgi:hypothetical protein
VERLLEHELVLDGSRRVQLVEGKDLNSSALILAGSCVQDTTYLGQVWIEWNQRRPCDRNI